MVDTKVRRRTKGLSYNSSLTVLLVLELLTRPVFPDGGELQAKNLTEIAAVYENVHQL